MNEKWFLLSLSEIENKLKTNAASGLSRKAARSRFSAKYGRVFSVPVKAPISYLGELISDFAYIILLAMSFLALCFGEGEIGTVCTVVLALTLAVSFVMYYRSQFFCDSLERVFLPRCKVVREGRVYSVSGENVVRGDVILLQKGDIVPADARLISSNKLRVKFLVEKDKYLLLDKTAEARIFENEHDPKNYSNMVHAASVVVSGTARAIVTDVGQFTCVGAKMGTLPCESKGRGQAPRLLNLFNKYCRRLSIILMLVVLPFSVLSMLFGNTTLSLFVAFMTAIALAASSMTQIAVTVCRAFYTVSMKRRILSYEPALVRSPAVLDKLADVKYLFVLDSAIITDGILHFEKSITVDGECSFSSGERIGKSEKRLSELAALYDGAQKTALSTGAESFTRYDGAIKEFVERAEADRAALGIRCNITGFSAASRTDFDLHDKLFYSEFGEKYMLSVSYTDSIINECSECLVDGVRSPIDDDTKNRLMNAFRMKKNAGKSLLVFTLSRQIAGEYSEHCFLGMLCFGEAYDREAVKALEKIKAQGIKPIFFRNTSVAGETVVYDSFPREIAGEGIVTPEAFYKNGLQISHKFGTIGCYSSFTDKQICELIDVAHAQRGRVAVCGFDDRFDSIYQKADVFYKLFSSQL